MLQEDGYFSTLSNLGRLGSYASNANMKTVDFKAGIKECMWEANQCIILLREIIILSLHVFQDEC